MRVRATAPTPIEWGVIAFGLWNATDLFQAWRDSPRDRWGDVLFGLWLLPWFYVLVRDRGLRHSEFSGRVQFTFLALAGILFGTLGDLNALRYAGLALAITLGAWEFGITAGCIWLLSSLSWMPALSYLTRSLPLNLTICIKFALILIAWFALFQTKEKATSSETTTQPE